MTTTKRNVVRCLVLCAIVMWPGVETWRYIQAQQALTESAAQHRAISERLAFVKSIDVPAPVSEPDSTVTPISNPVPTPEPDSNQ